MKIIDASGISCPEPLLILKNALKSENEVTLYVDSKNALENCIDFAKNHNFSIKTETEANLYVLHIKKE